MSLDFGRDRGDVLGRSPLYLQVRDRVVTAIEAGEWDAGEALPSEIDLADRYGVSQGTVRKGLDALVAEGVLHRRQGLGTFVAEAEDDWGSAVSLSGGQMHHATVELLACARANAGDEAAALGLRRGAALIAVKRLVRVQGEPFALIESAVSAERFDGLDARRIRQAGSNLRVVWWREFGLRVLSQPPVFRAARAGRDDARILGVAVEASLLEVTRVAHALAGDPVEWSLLRCRTDSYAYRV